MGTLSFKVSGGNLETYEALFLQLGDPEAASPVERVELTFGDVTQVFPPAFALLAAFLSRARDRAKRPLVSRRFGANPQTAKLERHMDAMGFLPALLDERAAEPRPGSGVIPLLPIHKDTRPEQVASRVLEIILTTAQPTRDAKECLFVVVTELVENVLRHGGRDSAAFLCGQLSAQKRKLELCLADAGIGVKASFENGKDAEAQRRIRAGESALLLALEPGRSSKGAGNTGFGLSVGAALARLNKGAFRLSSDDESVIISREGEKRRSHARWHGTVVNLLYNIDKVGSITEVYRQLPLPLGDDERFLPAAEALRHPDETVVALRGDSPYIGARATAARLRGQMLEAVRAGNVVVADLDGVAVLTPGFADECFGELLDAVGVEQFRKSVGVRNVNESGRLLLEAVLERRARVAAGGDEAVSSAPPPPSRAPRGKAARVEKEAQAAPEPAPEPEAEAAPASAAGEDREEPGEETDESDA